MSYKILPYSYKQAEKLNFEIKPSTNKNKKLVFLKIIGKLQVLELSVIMINPLL